VKEGPNGDINKLLPTAMSSKSALYLPSSLNSNHFTPTDVFVKLSLSRTNLYLGSNSFPNIDLNASSRSNLPSSF
jgi:hypothetical protein